MVVCVVLLMARRSGRRPSPRRRETGIMRLVGASNFTIQVPFVLETLIAALLDSVLGVGLLWATVRYGVSGYLSTRMLDTAFIGLADVWAITPIVVGDRASRLHLGRHLAEVPSCLGPVMAGRGGASYRRGTTADTWSPVTHVTYGTNGTARTGEGPTMSWRKIAASAIGIAPRRCALVRAGQRRPQRRQGQGRQVRPGDQGPARGHRSRSGRRVHQAPGDPGPAARGPGRARPGPGGRGPGAGAQRRARCRPGHRPGQRGSGRQAARRQCDLAGEHANHPRQSGRRRLPGRPAQRARGRHGCLEPRRVRGADEPDRHGQLADRRDPCATSRRPGPTGWPRRAISRRSARRSRR